MYYKKNNGTSRIKLSMQEIVDCSSENAGCQGGQPSSVADYIKSRGIDFEHNYRYIAKRQTCKANYANNKTLARYGERILEQLLAPDSQQSQNFDNNTNNNFNNTKFSDRDSSIYDLPHNTPIADSGKPRILATQDRSYETPNHLNPQTPNPNNTLNLNLNPKSQSTQEAPRLLQDLNYFPDYHYDRYNNSNGIDSFNNAGRSIQVRETRRYLAYDNRKRKFYRVVEYSDGSKKFFDLNGNRYIPGGRQSNNNNYNNGRGRSGRKGGRGSRGNLQNSMFL